MHKQPLTAQPIRTVACLAALVTVSVLMIGCGQSPGQALAGVLGGGDATPTPTEAARDAFDLADADKRRRSIILLSNADWGGEAPYVRTYRLLVDDADPTVRAACIQALGEHGGVDDVQVILRHLQKDDASIVRWEAAKALQKLHTDEAIDPLIRAAQDDEEIDVRLAAARALGQYPRPRVFDALLGVLTDDDFGVSHAARQSLKLLTGEDFGHEPEPWLQWSNDHQNLFTNGVAYTYEPYQHRGWLKKAQFWKASDAPPPQKPRVPTEVSAEGNESTGPVMPDAVRDETDDS